MIIVVLKMKLKQALYKAGVPRINSKKVAKNVSRAVQRTIGQKKRSKTVQVRVVQQSEVCVVGVAFDAEENVVDQLNAMTTTSNLPDCRTCKHTWTEVEEVAMIQHISGSKVHTLTTSGRVCTKCRLFSMECS